MTGTQVSTEAKWACLAVVVVVVAAANNAFADAGG